MSHRQPASRRLRGLGATGLLLLLVVGTPLALIATGAQPWTADFSKTQSLLTSPDDGTLALVIIAAIAWIAWGVMTASVVVELLAQLRGLPAPHLPGLALPQRTASHLVGTAALLFIAAPVALTGFPAASTNAAAAAPLLTTPRLEVVASVAPLPQTAAPVHITTSPASQREQVTVHYTVKHGDSLWKIAERLLGDGARYTDLVELNRDVLSGRPDFIVSGTVLRVPKEEAPEVQDGRTSEGYFVRTGDTLSDIAESKLGDPMLYPEIAAASRSTLQPDGAHLVDPDLIKPGWTLTIPGAAPSQQHQVEPPTALEPPVVVDPPRVVEPPHPPAAEPPTTRTSPPPFPEKPTTRPTADEPASDTVDTQNDQSPGWLVPGLTGSGAVLAAGVLLAIRAHRRTQLRYRRPGQRIAPPPSELLTVEKTAFVSGGSHVDLLGQLDRALRYLAEQLQLEGRSLAPVVSATLVRNTVTLRLVEGADLPLPWAGEDCEWSMALDDSLPDVDQIAPYPLLVSIGQSDTGGLLLLNLEHLGTTTLTGDAVAALALARHLAAELALNPWSASVYVETIGIGDELAELGGLRLRQHTPDTGIVEEVLAGLRHAEQAGNGEPEPFYAVITTETDQATQMTEILRRATSRLGAAALYLNETPIPDSVSAKLSEDGRLRILALGIDVTAAGLTSEEASACAAIIDLTRESPAIPIPVFTQAADGWRSLTDQAGALRPEMTEARTEGPVGRDSLLPKDPEEYIDVAAAVAADVTTLAPVVPAHVLKVVQHSDPTLDDDLADWFDTACPLPRLTLLGPVGANTPGGLSPAISKRKPYFVELLAYLALHPDGTTGNAIAEAFSIAGSRARTDLGHLRDWLGTNPRTGQLHLPLATASRSYAATAVKTYQLDDVLVDVDLFRRLRARGQARGSAGIGDLITALSLVEGQPFDLLRESGWSWLLDDERIHETIGASIVDTAHLLVLDALSRDDLSTARSVAESACRAAPYDDICRLDLVKVAATESGGSADQLLAAHIFNRTDDHLPPIDLPSRTADVVADQNWGSVRQSDSH
jgi:LysM repeat protein